MDRVTLTQLSVLFFLLYNTGWYHIAVEASRVTLTNNGYKNLVVAISSETPVNQSDIIISNIKVNSIKISDFKTLVRIFILRCLYLKINLYFLISTR
jgi:hypothetical protein